MAHHGFGGHGEALAGGQFAGPLTGPRFLATWGDAPIGDLVDYIRTSMPPGQAGKLSDSDYAALAALIVHENGSDPGQAVSPGLAARLPKPLPVEGSENQVGGGLSTTIPMPDWPAPPDPSCSA